MRILYNDKVLGYETIEECSKIWYNDKYNLIVCKTFDNETLYFDVCSLKTINEMIIRNGLADGFLNLVDCSYKYEEETDIYFGGIRND